MAAQLPLRLPDRPRQGGRRRGAGRKRAAVRPRVSHHGRAPHDRHCPVHVTLRARNDVPSLRRDRIFPFLCTALAAASTAHFRLLQFSIQGDHVHLLVEADDSQTLQRGMQGLAIRVARAVNRAVGRVGAVWADRYHSRPLRTPREVRNAIVYVLQNWKKHRREPRGVDPCSSGPWFAGWRTCVQHVVGPSPTRPPRTWLARVGWLRYGRLGVDEGPRPARPPTS